VNLWTVGCGRSRLTAQARSPRTSRGKPLAFPPPCHRSAAAHKLQTATEQQGMNLIPGKREHQPATSLSLLSRKLSKRPGPSQGSVLLACGDI